MGLLWVKYITKYVRNRLFYVSAHALDSSEHSYVWNYVI